MTSHICLRAPRYDTHCSASLCLRPLKSSSSKCKQVAGHFSNQSLVPCALLILWKSGVTTMGPQAVVLFDLHRDGPRSRWVYALNRRYIPSLRRYERNTNLSPGRRFRLGAVAPQRAGRSRRLTGRINGSIIHRMGHKIAVCKPACRAFSAHCDACHQGKGIDHAFWQTLPEGLIDSLAGAAQRSAWIERAVQSYAALTAEGAAPRGNWRC